MTVFAQTTTGPWYGNGSVVAVMAVGLLALIFVLRGRRRK